MSVGEGGLRTAGDEFGLRRSSMSLGLRLPLGTTSLCLSEYRDPSTIPLGCAGRATNGSFAAVCIRCSWFQYFVLASINFSSCAAFTCCAILSGYIDSMVFFFRNLDILFLFVRLCCSGTQYCDLLHHLGAMTQGRNTKAALQCFSIHCNQIRPTNTSSFECVSIHIQTNCL
mmetsp:Transcript_47119/g.125280  ORF Transcript_47119/g.125280 Transcript_47119/m.125280 type:complete len:172 (-) Transcript_47119:76-591(-)